MVYPSAQVVVDSDMVRYHRAEQYFNKITRVIKPLIDSGHAVLVVIDLSINRIILPIFQLWHLK